MKSVRQLVAHTSGGRSADAVACPQDLAHLLSHLGSLALQLPPLLTHLNIIAAQLGADPTLSDDRASWTAFDTNSTLLVCLDDARAAAEVLAQGLIAGSSCAVHLRTSGAQPLPVRPCG